VLDWVTGHPGRTEPQIASAVGSACVWQLLRTLEHRGLVAADVRDSPQHARTGGTVKTWRPAPAGTKPRPGPVPRTGNRATRREADRLAQARRRLRDRADAPSAPQLARQRLVDEVTARPGQSPAQLRDALGLKQRPVAVLERLESHGALTRRPDPARPGGWTWYPPEPAAPPPPRTPVRVLAGPPCTGENPEIFFPLFLAGPEVDKARAVCAPCPERRACLAGALTRAEPHGIWGGEVFEKGQVIAGRKLRERMISPGPGLAAG
jgi:WhiB family redox-sensing transcriptional regulator